MHALVQADSLTDREAKLRALLELRETVSQAQHDNTSLLGTKTFGTLHGELGNAYLSRIRGERGENLELAIAACGRALEMYTREAYPEDWAKTTMNLGNAYLSRIHGERGENLELAIAAFGRALEVLTREAYPEDWATITMNLASAYQNRIRGERGENLELAIAAYDQALEVFTKEAFPESNLQTQTALAEALLDAGQIDQASHRIRSSSNRWPDSRHRSIRLLCETFRGGADEADF